MKYLAKDKIEGFDVQRWITDNSALSATARTVAENIGKRYNREKLYFMKVSLQWIAAESRLSLSTVKRAVKEIEASNEWMVTKGGPKINEDGTLGRNAVTEYIPLFWQVSELPDGTLFVQFDETYKEVKEASEILTTSTEHFDRLIASYPKYFEKQDVAAIEKLYKQTPNVLALDVLAHYVASMNNEDYSFIKIISSINNAGKEKVFTEFINPTLEARENTRKEIAKEIAERIF